MHKGGSSMATNGRGRYQRVGARKRRGFGIGWTLFSILMVAAICVMGFYTWNMLRAGDAIATTQLDTTAGQSAPAAQSTDITAATEAPAATVAPAEETDSLGAGQTVSPSDTKDASASPSNSAPVEEPVDLATVASTEWPTQQFPSVLPFPNASYTTYLDGSHADILLPLGSEAGFKAYVAQLVKGGATVYVDNDRMTVLALGDVEIQLVVSTESPSISLCGESAISWEDTGDVLPLAGRLVSSDPGVDGLGAVLTYRCVSLSGLMEYLDLLKREGWISSDQASPVDGTFYATYQRGERTITVDYYANSSNFQIFLGTNVIQ
jgi:hypothetical protein